MAGHSKWAQIKHKKAATDAKKGQLFSRLIREITVAAKGGGASSESNPRLRAALEHARSAGLPKDNIARALARASGGGGGAELQEFLYEAAAPGGLNILIEGTTDNKNRSLAEIKNILEEHGAKLAEPGSISWGFERVGTIEAAGPDHQSLLPEEVELAIADSGARDFKKLNNSWIVETNPADLEKVTRSLEDKKIIIKNTYGGWRPRSPIRLPENLKESGEALLEALVHNEDIQEIHTNLEGTRP
ncbi:MAG: YebC/PmpR family DNA-binding transcriptional regulator [Candidatus Sungiibacteriota bacterium]|uniref:Probable transcriptional regulatory protein HYW89_02660 n=1 Tax=Candidatus Sungiibacteriota bacterium TaxID=2750080 RepID=A0A7T5RIQ1_9BACT|nr:MAG: YebC/PmpR family DNA-binding transcriptional regulator [Candidatus Sungbacteria bacterium]